MDIDFRKPVQQASLTGQSRKSIDVEKFAAIKLMYTIYFITLLLCAHSIPFFPPTSLI